ncbi:hypothetical protein DFH06DRAFT_1211639 [Mycena polygramma]|nr:hypothetical protein DFH06DRAFT_1211639 [Mycena polygramma]
MSEPRAASGSNSQPAVTSTRQRRPQRSCDICRQRKIPGDGPNTASGSCSNCSAFGSPCTYMYGCQQVHALFSADGIWFSTVFQPFGTATDHSTLCMILYNDFAYDSGPIMHGKAFGGTFRLAGGVRS